MASRPNTKKTHVKGDWTMCSKYDHHYMFDSQRDFLIHFYLKKYIYCGGGYMNIWWGQRSSLRWWIRYACEIQMSRGKWLQPPLGFATYIVLITCFILTPWHLLIGHSPKWLPSFDALGPSWREWIIVFQPTSHPSNMKKVENLNPYMFVAKSSEVAWTRLKWGF